MTISTSGDHKKDGSTTEKTSSKTINLDGDVKGSTTDDKITINYSTTVTKDNMSAALDEIDAQVTAALAAKGITDEDEVEALRQRVRDQYRDQWLNLRINAGNDDNDDLFAMYFHYDPTGNIENMQWRTFGNDFRSIYDATYDELNRMTGASYREFTDNNTYQKAGNYDVAGITYDKNGNIKTLNRIGQANGSSAPATIDALNYTYLNNQLQKVEDNATTQGFKDGSNTGNDYVYDANGNLVTDHNKGITIAYNHLNLPTIISFTDGKSITIVYDAVGIKLKKITNNNAGGIATKDYIAGLEYQDGDLESMMHDEGRITREFRGVSNGGDNVYKYHYEFTLKDHLGNARVVFSDKDRDGIVETNRVDASNDEVLQEEHYYPFGMRMNGAWNVVSGVENKYLYNGKEFNDDFGLNWSDYGARWYDASIGRWNAVDPLAERYFGMSPYNYVAGNPLRFIDPDGNIVVDPNSPDAKAYKAILDKTSVGKEVWKRMVDSPNKIHIHNVDFLTLKETGQRKGENWILAVSLIELRASAYVANGKTFDKIRSGQFDKLSMFDQIDGGTFNHLTGEYDFENSRDIHIIVDLNMIKTFGEEEGRSKKAIEKELVSITVEEGVHSTQNYIDLGKYFKKGTSGSYEELTAADLQRIYREVANSSRKSEENYNSQRNENEAKKEAKKASEEIK